MDDLSVWGDEELRFKLLRYYSIASAVVVLVVSIVLVNVFDRYATRNLIHSVEQQNETLAQIIGHDLSRNLGSELKHLDAESVDHGLLLAFAEAVDGTVRRDLDQSPILKIKAYWDGLTIYSTQQSQIGRVKDSPGFRTAEQEGKPASKLSFRGELNTFEEVIANRSLVETYVPIPSPEDEAGRHRLIVEVYTDVTPLLDDIKKSEVTLVLVLIGLLVTVYGVLLVIVWRADRVIRNQYTALDEEILERKEAEEEARTAHRQTEEAMSLIHESIHYASRIQRSVLPLESEMQAALNDHMVIWEPKDVVGGDIYLTRECSKGHLVMLMDCTGHGVPGAFMTMLATGAFDHALRDFPDGDPAALLHRTNQLVKEVLGQDGDAREGESDDGLECGLCLIPHDGTEVIYAGARFELWRLAAGEISIIKGERTGIGYRRTDIETTFENHSVTAPEGAAFFMFSDGITDQVGGDRNRAHGKRRLKDCLLKTANRPLVEQSQSFIAAFRAFQGDQTRRDDVSMIGFTPKTQTIT